MRMPPATGPGEYNEKRKQQGDDEREFGAVLRGEVARFRPSVKRKCQQAAGNQHESQQDPRRPREAQTEIRHTSMLRQHLISS